MKESININISSSTSAIGAVSQGAHAQTSGTATISREALIEDQYSRANQKIVELANELKCTVDELAAVQDNLQILMRESQAQAGNTEKASSTLKVIRENFSWAYPVAKDFISMVWPALLVAIG